MKRWTRAQLTGTVCPICLEVMRAEEIELSRYGVWHRAAPRSKRKGCRWARNTLIRRVERLQAGQNRPEYSAAGGRAARARAVSATDYASAIWQGWERG